MRSDGDDWVVTHAGRTFALKGTIGMTYLVTLLRHPGRELHALDLVTSGESSAAPAGDAGEMLDDRARGAYRRRLADLGAELEEAREFNDPGRAERLQAEIESLTDELARAVGLGGRTRRAGSDAERARLNVTRALKRVIEMVAARDAALGSDLERGVQTGNFCSYTPDPRVPVRWDV
jgi:non-specific serine/threonine protein kinase